MPLARRVQGRKPGIINRRERFITKALYAFGSKSGGQDARDNKTLSLLARES